MRGNEGRRENAARTTNKEERFCEAKVGGKRKNKLTTGTDRRFATEEHS